MAVVAVMLATVVAASISGGDGAPDPGGDHPHASFTFSTENSTVLVTHYGGDAMNGSRLYVESETRGRLGDFAGTNGRACAANVTRVEPGSTCRVPDAIYDRLYVVWEGPGNRTTIFARRLPDPTPSPTSTPTPTTTTPESSTGTSTGTDATPRETETKTETSTPGSNTSTQTPGNRTTTTPTPTTEAGGTATGTPGTTQTATATG